jgi:hypothetical protein
MAEENEPTGAEESSEGLAGGPGPTPPGFDDGTPRAAPATPASPAAEAAGEAEAPRGAPAADAARPRGDPEEPDPS